MNGGEGNRISVPQGPDHSNINLEGVVYKINPRSELFHKLILSILWNNFQSIFKETPLVIWNMDFPNMYTNTTHPCTSTNIYKNLICNDFSLFSSYSEELYKNRRYKYGTPQNMYILTFLLFRFHIIHSFDDLIYHI